MAPVCREREDARANRSRDEGAVAGEDAAGGHEQPGGEADRAMQLAVHAREARNDEQQQKERDHAAEPATTAG